MAFSEIDSFLTKFKYLWHAGLKASLNVESENGEASITLKVGLGCIPPPFCFQRPPQPKTPPVYRGPAYQRRQQKRQAAKLATTPVQVDGAEEARKQDEEIDIDQHDSADEVAEEATGNAEHTKSVLSFDCELCDFQSNWKNGLSIHMTKKHSKLNQLDGNFDENYEDEEYKITKHYWKSGFLGSGYQCFLDAEKLIKESDLDEVDKEKEQAKLLEARKSAFGDNYKHFPPWDSR